VLMASCCGYTPSEPVLSVQLISAKAMASITADHATKVFLVFNFQLLSFNYQLSSSSSSARPMFHTVS